MITILTSIIGLITALCIMLLVRKDHLHVRYGLGWIAVAIVLAFLGAFPAIFDRLAIHLGVAYPPILAFTLGFSLLIVKILVSDIERSHDEIKISRLVQRVALLELEIAELRKAVDQKPAEALGQSGSGVKKNVIGPAPDQER